MSTPLALTLSLPLWAVLAALVLGVLGIAVGRTTGRLVHLFGPVHPPQVPGPSALPGPPFPEPRPAGPQQPPPVQEGPASGTASREPLPGAPAAPADPPARTSRASTAHAVAGSEYEEEDDGPPPPRCPRCRAELAFARALPTVADRHFRQRGACPHCEQRVRPHPAVVITTALLFALIGALAPYRLLDWSLFGLLALLWLAALGTLLSVIDLRVMRLPDVIVAPAYPLAALLLTAAVLLPPTGPDLGRGAQALTGMVLITVLYWLLWRIRPGGLGFGDVKLSGLTGLYAGWAAGPAGALVAAFWAFAAFSLLGLALMALRRITRAEPLPLGPFMLAATLATVLAGHPLLPQP